MGGELVGVKRLQTVVRRIMIRDSNPLFHYDLVTLRTCVSRRQPFGREDWQAKIAATLGLESTMRQRGRPRKPLEKWHVPFSSSLFLSPHLDLLGPPAYAFTC